MMNIYVDTDDEKFFDPEAIEAASVAALKITQKWLSRESIRRFNKKLRIRSAAGRKRVKTSKVKNQTGSVWFGLRPIGLAYIRDYEQTKGGVVSGGERFYKGAFVQSMNGSGDQIFRRKSERQKAPNPRRKRSPNGTTRDRTSPLVEFVREDMDDADNEIMILTAEVNEIFKEAFLNELHK